MRIVVIGGTGHIGSYLTPWLVRIGHEVICVSRKEQQPYFKDESWGKVEMVKIDRSEAEKKGVFGNEILRLRPDVVIDLICFELNSAKQIVEALDGQITHFIHCGTMWVHGHSMEVPTRENQSRNPIGSYGKKKASIEKYLLNTFESNKFPVTILHPGHISGPGWLPINPVGNFNPDIFIRLSKGEPIQVPNIGMETLHHVHARDVAQAFIKSIENFNKAVGESFHVVSDQAITLRGYAENVAKWFGNKAKIEFIPFEQWAKNVSKKEAKITWDHIAHSPNGSTEKSKRMLFFKPNYSSMEAIKEAMVYYFEKHHPDIKIKK